MPHFAAMKQPIVIRTRRARGSLRRRGTAADGAVLIRPDLSVASILARHGEQQLTDDELPDWVGELPTDDEG